MGTLARARAGCTSTLVYRKRLLLLHLQAARKSGGQSERQRGALGGRGAPSGETRKRRQSSGPDAGRRVASARSSELSVSRPSAGFLGPVTFPFSPFLGAAVGAVPRGLGRRREGSAAQTRLHKGRARPASAPFTEKCVLFMKATPRHRGPGTATLSRRRARAAPRAMRLFVLPMAVTAPGAAHGDSNGEQTLCGLMARPRAGRAVTRPAQCLCADAQTRQPVTSNARRRDAPASEERTRNCPSHAKQRAVRTALVVP